MSNLLSNEKIEELRNTLHIAISASDFRTIEAAVLEAQKQEPVAWIHHNGVDILHDRNIEPVRKACGAWLPLYAAPVVQPCPCNGEGCYNCDAWDKQSVIAAAEGKHNAVAHREAACGRSGAAEC